MTTIPHTEAPIWQHPQDQMLDVLPGQPATIYPTLHSDGEPHVAAVIQAADQHSAEYYRSRGEAIDRLVIVDMRSVPALGRWRSFDGQAITASADYLLLDPVNLDWENNQGYRAIRKGEPFNYGRPSADLPASDKRNRFSGASNITSRKHFRIYVGEQGDVTVSDLESTNGTQLLTGDYAEAALSSSERAIRQDLLGSVLGRVSLGQRLITSADVPNGSNFTPKQRVEYVDPTSEYQFLNERTPNFENAASLHPDELWAEPNNGGRPQDAAYITLYREARKKLVETFNSGQLYKSAEEFTKALKDQHRFIASSGIYNRLNPHNALEANEIGEFRIYWGRANNARLTGSLLVADIAEQYGDAYAKTDYGYLRFICGKPNSESVSTVQLPDIRPENLPYDVVRYDEGGLMKPINRVNYDESGYQFFYPDAEHADEYMAAIQKIGVEITEKLADPAVETVDILKLIAQQYQYGANIRPFKQINNSLFMELANMQVKLLGHEGMTHGGMDIAAQRLQPEAFTAYFVDRAMKVAK